MTMCVECDVEWSRLDDFDVGEINDYPTRGIDLVVVEIDPPVAALAPEPAASWGA